jgi:hypothetical protein
MCATCGCNYPNLDHAMANAKGITQWVCQLHLAIKHSNSNT